MELVSRNNISQKSTEPAKSTKDLLKDVSADIQLLISKEAALAETESRIALKSELSALKSAFLAAALAIGGTSIFLAAVLIGLFGWKAAAIIGGVIAALSIIPATIALKTHDSNIIPETRSTLREEAKWIKETFSKLQ